MKALSQEESLHSSSKQYALVKWRNNQNWRLNRWQCFDIVQTKNWIVLKFREGTSLFWRCEFLHKQQSCIIRVESYRNSNSPVQSDNSSSARPTQYSHNFGSMKHFPNSIVWLCLWENFHNSSRAEECLLPFRNE